MSDKSPADLLAETLLGECSKVLDKEEIDLAKEAELIEKRLWRSQRDQYVEWLRSRGRREIRSQLQQAVRDRRRTVRMTIGRRFEEVTDRWQRGELTAEEMVDQWRVNTGDGIEIKLMDATGCDLDVVIERQATIARSALLEEAFYRYLRERVAVDQRVGQVLSAEQIVRVRRQLSGEQQKGVAVAVAA